MQRLVTAAFMIPVVVYGIVGGHPWLFYSLVTLVAWACFYEYARLLGAGTFMRLTGMAAGAAFLLLPAGNLWIFATLFALASLVLAMRCADLNAGVREAVTAGFGLLYVFGAWRAGVGLQERSPYWLLFALAVNWVGDSFAYYVGRAIGRHKLAPRVSPGKSWEGSIASSLSAILFGVLLLPRILPAVTLWQAAALALIANVAGQLGDLAESALKRSVGAKDSGTLLPGHGGMLDRVDSAMFSMPVLYALLVTFGLG